MKSFTIFFFFILLSVSSIAYRVTGNAKECREDEEWSACGDNCEPSCEDPDPMICKQNCVIGCFCKEGLLREDGEKGKCLKPEQCRINQ